MDTNDRSNYEQVIQAIEFLKEAGKDPELRIENNLKCVHVLGLLRKRMHIKQEKSSTHKHPVVGSFTGQKKISKTEPTDRSSVKSTHADGGYCCDCCLDIDEDERPWESEPPIKAAKKAARGRYMGQFQQQMEDYLRCVNRIYGTRSPIPNGLHDSQLCLLKRARLLGQLASPLVPTTVVERWSPHEVAVFEAAICIYGKEFHRISDAIQSKSTSEVIEFYYAWKFSSHYYSWKAHYRSKKTPVHRSGSCVCKKQIMPAMSFSTRTSLRFRIPHSSPLQSVYDCWRSSYDSSQHVHTLRASCAPLLRSFRDDIDFS